MMSRKTLIVLVVNAFLGASASSVAADFWQKKKYSEWTPKEVQTMLNSSPWARTVVVATGSVEAPSMSGGRGRPPSAGVDRSGRGGSTGGDDRAPQGVTLTVRFHSALPVKQAVVRGRYGDAALSSPEAAGALARKEESILIGITGSPRVLSGEPDSLKEGARLVIKGRAPIPAAEVLTERGEGGISLYFAFPRPAEPLTLADESVELQLKFRSHQIKQRFKLKDMVFDGKPEL